MRLLYRLRMKLFWRRYRARRKWYAQQHGRPMKLAIVERDQKKSAVVENIIGPNKGTRVRLIFSDPRFAYFNFPTTDSQHDVHRLSH